MAFTHENRSESLEPVWVTFRQIPWGSIGWRMGAGEDSWFKWMPWYRGLGVEKREQYKVTWPEPEGWTDFYRFVETGATPRWAEVMLEGPTDT